jgi:predicted DNA-binding transcriptional regulator YafY
MEISRKEYGEQDFPITTVKEYAEMKEVTRPTVYRWLDNNKLNYVTIPITLAKGGVRPVKHIALV